MKRKEEREWLARLAYQMEVNPEKDFSAKKLLKSHDLSEDNAYLLSSLDSLWTHWKEIDQIIVRFLDHWELDRLRWMDKAILRISINEMVFTKLAPLPVTINEGVDLAKAYSDSKSFSFVNGLLSSVAKAMEAGDLDGEALCEH